MGQGTSGGAGVIGHDGLDHRQRAAQVTIADLYERGYHQYGSRVAVRDGATTLTYCALGDRVHRIARGLASRFVRTALSTRLHLRELVHVLSDSTTAVVFASPDWAERLAEVRDQLPALRHVVTVAGGPGDTTLDRLREAAPAPCTRPLPHHPATILYTSGTTGMPKGATLSHANRAATVRNEPFMVTGLPTTGAGKIMRRHPRDRYWTAGDRKVGA
ncbi:AMP-binding protein [Streptomyces sp. KR55]|uniref:AMP-binding protein n=1 Tax=Streptomyces sp. KR55 TaxID=3457425 RepID=UPI003FD1DC65